jgi:hypothetical protein
MIIKVTEHYSKVVNTPCFRKVHGSNFGLETYYVDIVIFLNLPRNLPG